MNWKEFTWLRNCELILYNDWYLALKKVICMDTPFIAFAVIALVGLGVLAVAGFDASITGQPTIPISKLRQVASSFEEEHQPYSAGISSSGNSCNCPDLYGNNIVTKQENSVFAGTSIIDCILAREIVKQGEALKLDTSGFDVFKNLCKSRGWW
jgi:hypothetical protein